VNPDRAEVREVLELVAREAAAYLESLDARKVRSPGMEAAVRSLGGELPETGVGAAAALRELLDRGFEGAVASSGPRYYHFVIGGVTPAALGADWLTTVLDQCAYAWASSPLGVQLEVHALAWLRDLFGLPPEWGGLMTTGASQANFVALAAARQWWGERHGVDVAERGLSGLPPVPVLSGGYIHASSVKCLAMLGIGRSSLCRFRRDAIGRLDVDALAAALRELDGAPAILVANAGEVNAGEFDPIDELADLAEEHDAWLHVDGAFGLFARLSPRTAHLAAGTERADSVTVDGHKWLNVPYDCGYAFVAERERLVKAFSYTGDYLPALDDPRPNFGTIGPESSRRGRAFATWATLRAYGRQGYREMVERHLDLAQYLARLVDEAPDLERLAEVPLNIVCFRYRPDGETEEELDALNARLGEALLEDGRFYAGTTKYGTKTALRPTLVNWRTRESDLEEFVAVVRELGSRVAARGRR
jgi:glutamate/tyrosine decarboxylase-like PLP-dependent enzyme